MQKSETSTPETRFCNS